MGMLFLVYHLVKQSPSLPGYSLVVQMRVLGNDKRFKLIIHTLGVFLNLRKRQPCPNGSHRDTVDLSVQRRLIPVKHYIVQLIHQEPTYTADQQGFANSMMYRMLLEVNCANFKN